MKRSMLLRLALLAVLALVGLVIAVWLTGPTHRINREAFARITNGMSREEVEALLNCPPGDYSSTRGDVQRFRDLQEFFDALARFDARNEPPASARSSHTCGFWATDDFALCVHFDDDNAVTNTRFSVRGNGFRARLGRLLSSVGLAP